MLFNRNRFHAVFLLPWALYHEQVMRGKRIGLLFAITAFSVHAENGYDAWLRYQRLPARVAEADLQALGDSVTLLGKSEIVLAARDELSRGLQGMLGRVPRVEVGGAIPSAQFAAELPADGFRIKTVLQGSTHYTVIA